MMEKENIKNVVNASQELEEFLKMKKKEAENKKKKEKNAFKAMKDNYYAYHSDIKTSARDNGEW